MHVQSMQGMTAMAHVQAASQPCKPQSHIEATARRGMLAGGSELAAVAASATAALSSAAPMRIPRRLEGTVDAWSAKIRRPLATSKWDH